MTLGLLSGLQIFHPKVGQICQPSSRHSWTVFPGILAQVIPKKRVTRGEPMPSVDRASPRREEEGRSEVSMPSYCS